VTGVRIIVPTLGGGYGGKGHPTIEPVAAVLSLLTRRPVRIQLSREEEFVTITKHAASVRIVTGVSRDGMLLARRAECIFNTGAYADVGPRVAKNGGYGMAGPYRIPDISVDSYAVYTNLPPAGAFRAFGVPQGAWAYESQMDIIADRLGIDPVAIRRKNLLRDGEELSTGQLMEDSHFEELLDLVAPAVREDGVRAAEQRGRRTCRGTGFATIVKGTVTPSTSTAIVKLNQDGSADVLTSAVEMGQGFKKTMALIVGRELGISAGRVSVSDPDTDVTPYDQQTSSSRSTYATGSAVRQAAVKIRSQLLADASEQLEVAEADLELSDGRVAVVGTPSSGATIAEVMARSRRGNLIGDGMYRSEGGLDPSTGRGIASVHWHQAAGAADVEVDLDTGKISLLGFRTSVFAGQVINQVGAELQTEGNLAFGLGQALFEELLFDGGQVQNGNLGDYMVASILDMPPSMDVTFLEDPSGNVIHGLGETSLPTIMPAIANAVFAATGARVRELPITPERLLRALAAQPERGSAAVGTSA
jgi:CO/xanthine dehydrogenase Mo-binding subunit